MMEPTGGRARPRARPGAGADGDGPASDGPALPPLVELHVHLEATAGARLLRAVGTRTGVSLAAPVFQVGPRRAWSTFGQLLLARADAAQAFATPASHRTLTRWYLTSIAAQGAIYAELALAPQQVGLHTWGLRDLLAAVSAGIADARTRCGIEARIVVTALRELSPTSAVRMVDRVAGLGNPFVTGFGLAGDARLPIAGFASAFGLAAEAGFGCTVDAGALRGAASVREALELPVTRIGHGTRAIEDPGLVAELRERAITLECCPTSDVALGVVPSWEEHPLRRLFDAGVRVTLSSADPPYLGCTLAGEHRLARRHHGFEAGELRQLTAWAVEGAFLDEMTRTALRWILEGRRPVAVRRGG